MGEKLVAASRLGPCQWAVRRGLWGSARHSLSLSRGPASSPADRRPEGLEGPGLEGRDPLLTALSAGTAIRETSVNLSFSPFKKLYLGDKGSHRPSHGVRQS